MNEMDHTTKRPGREPSIRRAAAEDFDRLVDIWLEASVSAHDFIPRERWAAHTDDMKNVYLPASETWLCRVGERIVGFVSLVGDRIEALFVDPLEQGRGYGGMLLRFAQERHPRLSLSVFSQNRRAVKFYEAAGFAMVEERIEERTGQPELEMVWSNTAIEAIDADDR